MAAFGKNGLETNYKYEKHVPKRVLHRIILNYHLVMSKCRLNRECV